MPALCVAVCLFLPTSFLWQSSAWKNALIAAPIYTAVTMRSPPSPTDPQSARTKMRCCHASQNRALRPPKVRRLICFLPFRMSFHNSAKRLKYPYFPLCTSKIKLFNTTEFLNFIIAQLFSIAIQNFSSLLEVARLGSLFIFRPPLGLSPVYHFTPRQSQ